MNVERTPVLVVRIACPGVAVTMEDPEVLAEYLLDRGADDPVPTLLSAEWEDGWYG